MKLSDQVVSLELAKELKELGVKQESLFYWVDTGSVWDTIKLEYVIQENYHLESRDYEFKDCVQGRGGIDNKSGLRIWNSRISAFTVAELGEMLPWGIEDEPIDIFKDSDDQWNFYIQHEKAFWTKSFNDTEASARAKMLIYLIKEKYMESPK